MEEQNIYIYSDGAGNLHENESIPHFVLGGYAFMSLNERDAAKRAYIKKSKVIRKSIKHNGELKAKHLAFNHPKEQTKLLRLMKNYKTLYVHVNRDKIYKKANVRNKKDINNYKVYCLTLMMRSFFDSLKQDGLINYENQINLNVYIDQDKRSTSGWYDLDVSIRKELLVGKMNYWGNIKPVFVNKKPKMNITVQQFNSECEPLGQAADMLVNRVWHNYINETENKYHHIYREMP